MMCNNLLKSFSKSLRIFLASPLGYYCAIACPLPLISKRKRWLCQR